MDEPLDLQDVTAFLAVVDTGSFTAAAARLGLAKSNVSRRVARLEQRLGARLLERTTRRQRLTEVGTSYHALVTGAVEQLAEAARSVSELQGQPVGHLKVTAPTDLNEGLGRLIAEFSARYPEIELEAELSQRRVDLVAEGFDVALRAGKLEDSSLVARSVGDQTWQLYASPRYLARRGEPRTPQALADHECLLFRARRGQVQWHLDGPDGPHEITVRGAISAQDFGFLRAAAIEGAGITMLPESMVPEALARGQLVRVMPEYCLGRSSFHLVYPSTRFLSPKVRVFVDFCVEWFKTEDESREAAGLVATRGRRSAATGRPASSRRRAPGKRSRGR